MGGSSIDVISPVSEAGACTKRPTVSSLLFLFIDFDHSIIWGKIYPMILEHELKSHETSFDNPGLFSNFTYVKMKGPNKQLSNQSISNLSLLAEFIFEIFWSKTLVNLDPALQNFEHFSYSENMQWCTLADHIFQFQMWHHPIPEYLSFLLFMVIFLLLLFLFKSLHTLNSLAKAVVPNHCSRDLRCSPSFKKCSPKTYNTE